jgi:hypothetical protein
MEQKQFVIQRISSELKNSLSPKPQRQDNKRFVITKRIAKHGNQAIIVIPKLLEQKLSPGTIVQISIEKLEV